MVTLLPNTVSFLLPSHKADKYFEGNCIVVLYSSANDDPNRTFSSYFSLHDHQYSYHPQLLLHSNGSIPLQSWFLQQLCNHLPLDVSYHSLHAVPLHWFKLALPPTSFRLKVIGPLTPSRSTYNNTPHCLQHCCMDQGHPQCFALEDYSHTLPAAHHLVHPTI